MSGYDNSYSRRGNFDDQRGDRGRENYRGREESRPDYNGQWNNGEERGNRGDSYYRNQAEYEDSRGYRQVRGDYRRGYQERGGHSNQGYEDRRNDYSDYPNVRSRPNYNQRQQGEPWNNRQDNRWDERREGDEFDRNLNDFPELQRQPGEPWNNRQDNRWDERREGDEFDRNLNDFPELQRQPGNHAAPHLDQYTGTSAQSQQKQRAISPVSTTSIASIHENMTSSTFNVTPVACSPSPATAFITETVAQLNLEQGTSKQSENCCSHLLVDPPMLPANRDDKTEQKLTTNMFPMEIQQKTVCYYEVTMKILTPGGKEVSLSKGGNKLQRADICMAAMRAALEAYGLFRAGEAALYGGAEMLYSSESLLAALKPHSSVLNIEIADLPVEIRRLITDPKAENIVIEFGEEKQFNIADYDQEHRNRDLENLNRSHQAFFDALTKEPALRSGKFMAFGAGKMFPRNAPVNRSQDGQHLQSGINKGIVFIEPTPERMIPALVLDLKIGQFYVHQNLTKTICDLMRWKFLGRFPVDKWRHLNKFIKGMKLTLITGHHERSFVASGLSNEPIGQLTERTFDKKQVPVLKAPRFGNLDLSQVRQDWPAVAVCGMFGKSSVIYYPVELLMVAKNQRVPQYKLYDKPPATKVQERFSAIHGMVEALDLHTRSPYKHILQAFGITIGQSPLKTDGIRRKLPGIASSTGVAQPSVDRASFKIFGLKEPGKADDIVVAFNCDPALITALGGALEKAAREKGIKGRWHSLDVSRLGTNVRSQVHAAFVQVDKWKKERKVGQTVLLIYVDKDQNSHDYLKFFERKYLIPNQHLTAQVAETLPRMWQKRDNFLYKMNCKLGGINYSVLPDDYAKNDWINNGKSLIIGYDVAHPTGMPNNKEDKQPPNQVSVVGMSFNGAKNPETFIGDFHYQLPRAEEVNDQILTGRIKWMLELFYKNRGRLPENIFFLRDGVSEGQYNMVLNKEFPAFQDGIDEFKNMKEDQIPKIREWKPKYVVVVVCKRHNKRFAVENGQRNFENALPGTVVDQQVVRKDMTHFYLQPHNVIKGTGKFPSYHVLKYDLDKEDNNKTQDKLQAFMVGLCFNHQIFTSSISLPEPTYQADEWAKRGNSMFHVYQEFSDLPRLKTWNKQVYSSPPIDYEELTRQLSYKDTELQELRINA